MKQNKEKIEVLIKISLNTMNFYSSSGQNLISKVEKVNIAVPYFNVAQALSWNKE